MKKLYAIIAAVVLAFLFTFSVCSCSRTVTLYFASMVDSRPYLAEEIRQIEGPGNIYKTAVEELIKGPLAKGLSPTLPSDTVVNSVIVSDGLATVDFNIRIINNFEEIKRVKITIEGSDSGEVDGCMVEDFWGHVGIYEIFERNEEIIKDE